MKASIIEKLREHRLKLTSQRIAIIEAFLNNISLHPPASLIYEEARKRVRNLSLSTVYATFKAEKGESHRKKACGPVRAMP
jgi:Fe2+ or Zn2+ uptake regulation protein